MLYRLSDKYYVRAMQEHDLLGPYSRWFEDQSVTKFNSHGKFAYGPQYYRSFVASLVDERKLVWAICHDYDGHIGNISLQSISLINRNAEFAILIGDKNHWGQGVAYLAMLQILKHGFEKLNLARVYCGTSHTNIGMQKLAEKVGMRLEGRRREHLYLEGSWVDMLEYGILKNEFTKLHS